MLLEFTNALARFYVHINTVIRAFFNIIVIAYVNDAMIFVCFILVYKTFLKANFSEKVEQMQI